MENIIEWNNKKLVLHEFSKSHANGGRLGKYWVEDLNSGKQYLIKSSSLFSYEPFCEKMAYIIGRDLGIDVLEYDILPAELFRDVIDIHFRCKYVSICEKIDRKGYSITSVAEIKRAMNALKAPNEKAYKNKEIMYSILDEKYVDTMILFDAIIGNRDRHYGNVHILRGKDGELLGAPLLDNGNSLLATRQILFPFGYKVGAKYNESCTVEFEHDKQICYISSINHLSYNVPCKTIQIMNDIEPVLELMPKRRAEYTRRFIIYRLHKYLTLLKREPAEEMVKLKPKYVEYVIKNKDI